MQIFIGYLFVIDKNWKLLKIYIYIYIYTYIHIYINKCNSIIKRPVMDTCNGTDKSQMNYGEWKKSDNRRVHSVLFHLCEFPKNLN